MAVGQHVLGFAFLEHALTASPVDHFYVKGAHVNIECWAEAMHALTLKVGVHAAVLILGMCMAEQTGTSKEFAVVEVESGNCFGLLSSISIEGLVIGQVGPINVDTTEGEIAFKTVAEEQAVTKFEGVSGEDVLSAFGFHVGLEANPKIVFSEKEKLEA